MQDYMTWLSQYPSRIVVTEWFVILCLYVMLARCKRHNKQHNKRRFVYCENGRKSNIAYVELVSQHQFDNYELYVGLPIIDMNNTSIYFALPNEC